MRIRHLRDKLILSSLVVIAVFVAWNLTMQIIRYRESREYVIEAQRDVALDVAAVYGDRMHDIITLERITGAMLCAPGGVSRAEAQTYIEEMVRAKPGIMHVALADSRGVIKVSSFPALVGRDVSQFSSVRRVMQGDEWAVSSVFASRAMERPVFSVVTGIRCDGSTLDGIMMSMLSESEMGAALQPGVLRGTLGGETVVLIDAQGRVALVHGGPEMTWEERDWSGHSFVRGALQGLTAVVENFRMPDGTAMFGMVTPVPEFGWATAVLIPRERILGPVRRGALQRLLLVLGLAGLMIGFSVYAGNKLAGPVMSLASAARAFGAGDFAARADIRTGDELEVLGDSFNEMALALQQGTEQLHAAVRAESEEAERASALYSMAQGLVVNTHLKGRLEVIAQALASLAGVKRCSIYLKRADRLVGVAGWGLQRPGLSMGESIAIPGPSRPFYETLLTGTPVFVPDAEREPRVDQDIIERYNVKAFLALPLARARHMVGLAVLDNPGERMQVDTETVNTARGLASLAAIAIENAETFEKWVNIAESFQRAMLPEVPKRIKEFHFASRYYSAQEMAELGGDFYDFMTFPDGRVGLVIADVSGKGMDAAVYTAMGKYTLRAFVAESPDPGEALTRSNNTLAEMGGEWGFVTMFIGLLDPDTGRLVYSSAGHPPPLVATDSGEVIWLPCEDRQPPLGGFGGIDYRNNEYVLSRDDVLLCYTDGIIEARRDGERFEIESLASLLAEYRRLDPDGIADAVWGSVTDFSRGRIQDDTAILVIKRQEV